MPALRARAPMTRTARAGRYASMERVLSAGPYDPPRLPPSAPENLAAIALDDHSVSLTWTNNDPAATDFQIERAPEDGDVRQRFPLRRYFPHRRDGWSSGLQEGVTFIYRVRALAGRAATLRRLGHFLGHGLARSPGEPGRHCGEHRPDRPFLDQCFHGCDRVQPGTSRARGHVRGQSPGPGTDTTFSAFRHPASLRERRMNTASSPSSLMASRTTCPRTVKSAPSAIASATTLAFTAAFTAPPGTLTTDAGGRRGILRGPAIEPTLLTAGGTHGAHRPARLNYGQPHARQGRHLPGRDQPRAAIPMTPRRISPTSHRA